MTWRDRMEGMRERLKRKGICVWVCMHNLFRLLYSRN